MQMTGSIQMQEVALHSGLFINRNFAVEAAAVIAAGCAFYRLWWLLPGLVPTLLAGARAPLLALGMVGAFFLWRRSKLMAAGCFIASLVVMYGVSVSAPNGMSSASSMERWAVWLDILPGLSILGHGLGSFNFEFPTLQVHTNALEVRFEHPHSDILQLAYELGIVGVALYGCLVFRLLRVPATAASAALAVFLIEGAFSFPIYLPVTGFLAALCAGYISQPGDLVRGRVRAGRQAVRFGDENRRHWGLRVGS
jgi:O-antigen ligase